MSTEVISSHYSFTPFVDVGWEVDKGVLREPPAGVNPLPPGRGILPESLSMLGGRGVEIAAAITAVGGLGYLLEHQIGHSDVNPTVALKAITDTANHALEGTFLNPDNVFACGPGEINGIVVAPGGSKTWQCMPGTPGMTGGVGYENGGQVVNQAQPPGYTAEPAIVYRQNRGSVEPALITSQARGGTPEVSQRLSYFFEIGNFRGIPVKVKKSDYSSEEIVIINSAFQKGSNFLATQDLLNGYKPQGVGIIIEKPNPGWQEIGSGYHPPGVRGDDWARIYIREVEYYQRSWSWLHPDEAMAADIAHEEMHALGIPEGNRTVLYPLTDKALKFFRPPPVSDDSMIKSQVGSIEVYSSRE